MPISSYVQLSSIAAISTGAIYLSLCPRNNLSSWNVLGRKIAVGVMLSGGIGWILYWSLKKSSLKSKKAENRKIEISHSVPPPLSSAVVTGGTQNPTNSSISSTSLQSVTSEASTQNATTSKVESPLKVVENKIVQSPKQSENRKIEISHAVPPSLSSVVVTGETQNPKNSSILSNSLQSVTSEASTQNATTSKVKSPLKIGENKIEESSKQAENRKIEISHSVPPPLSSAVVTGETQNPTNSSISSTSLQSVTSEASTQNATTSKVESPLKVGENKIVQSPKQSDDRKNEVCDCGVEGMDDKEKYSEETTQPNSLHPITFPNKTIIFPLFYESYRPVNLTHPSEGQTQISAAAMQKPAAKEDATMLTPFRPILHSMYYAHRHALLIEDLIQNYQFLED